MKRFYRWVRAFFSLSLSNRLQVWRADLNLIGLGLALAVMVFAYQPAEQPTPWDNPLLAVFALASAWFLIAGFLHRVPAVDAEQRWDEWYDQLRDKSEEFSNYMTASFPAPPTSQSWQDLACQVPIPQADERPLYEWNEFLKTHPRDDVRRLFAFVSRVQGHPLVGTYRRMAIRSYERFGELRATNARGFRNWMAAEGVMIGAEPLVVILAYLEIAKASEVHFEGPGRAREGFWSLAEEWHSNNTLQLPKRPIQPSLGPAKSTEVLPPPESSS